jgi:predicted unusual protein kinase regulating ubiquinone biosynthesis (AarF/ABC1/UbiB family)
VSDDKDRKGRRQSRVPVTRTGRLLRLGLTAGGLAVGGLSEGLKRLGRGEGMARAGAAIFSGENAKRLARQLAHMRGAAMKLGQLLSLESEHLLPPEFAEALALLRRSADVMPVSQVRGVLGREYGKGWEARFESFDFEPAAAASIGQVHRAVALDGRRLALKIQYPGVAKSIDSDVDNLAMFLNVARLLPRALDVKDIITEAKRQLRQEADYIAEAASLERFAALLADDPRFVVPGVHRDLSTRRVLAMDWVEGEPLEALVAEGAEQSTRDAAAAALEDLTFRELFEFGFMQTDPNFANYVLLGDGRIGLLDFGAATEFSADFVERYLRITRAIVADDRERVRSVAAEIGYLHGTDSERHQDRIVNIIFLACEPLMVEGPYDYGASDLPRRATAAGFDLVFGSREFRNPPAATAVLHRKLLGSFLLSQRLKARVDVRRLLLPRLQ